MIKQNKWKLILSSLLILLPVLFGFCIRDHLPGQIATHWVPDGTADGFSSPLTAILLMPFFLLLLHWIGILVTFRDNRKNEQNKTVLGMVFWICPVISLFTNGFMYAIAFGMEMHMGMFILLTMGVTFLVIGNYLPKCRQNRTIGIKISWTLANEENWNATHRFSGKVYVIIGILTLAAAFLPVKALPWVSPALILPAVLIPVLYSYFYHKKQCRQGDFTVEKTLLTKGDKYTAVIVGIFVLLTLIFCLVLCFTGNISVSFGEDSFTVQASYSSDPAIRYGDIDFAEFRESDDPGSRISGFGTPRLLMGWFRNEEFGDYTRYSYARGGACVVMHSGGKVIVIGLKTDAETKAFYHELNSKINAEKEPPV